MAPRACICSQASVLAALNLPTRSLQRGLAHGGSRHEIIHRQRTSPHFSALTICTYKSLLPVAIPRALSLSLSLRKKDMGLFGWVASKIAGPKQQDRSALKPTASSCSSAQSIVRANSQASRQDEFSDWPESLLSIGTLGGGNTVGEASQKQAPGDSVEGGASFALEEITELQKVLDHLMRTHQEGNSETGRVQGYDVPHNPPGEHVEDGNAAHHSSDGQIIASKRKDVLPEKRGLLDKRWVACLLRNSFPCKGAFRLSSSELRDPISQSRMEKFLKALLQRKIHPRTSTMPLQRKHLPDAPQDQSHITEEKENEGAKWVRTDSEYIVLEI